MYFRKGFLEFKDRKIDNETVTNGVYLKSVSIPITPKYSYNTTMIPNTDTTLYTTAGLEDKRITAVFHVYAKSRQEKRQKINQLVKGWVGNEPGKLIIGDDPDVFHVARVLDEIQESESDGNTIVTVTFLASPTKQSLVEITHTIAPATSSKVIEYVGDYKVLPIVEFAGTGTVGISVNGSSFSVVLVNETVFVDCKELTVHNASYVNKIDKFTGNFIELHEGANTVMITGNTTVTTKIRYRNTFLTGGSYA